ncbi:MAG: hypothetical protein EBR81_14180 [Proteobacteria bacterium]|nr:hypothetical protein [Pseudomonadota bacterium]
MDALAGCAKTQSAKPTRRTRDKTTLQEKITFKNGLWIFMGLFTIFRRCDRGEKGGTLCDLLGEVSVSKEFLGALF